MHLGFGIANLGFSDDLLINPKSQIPIPKSKGPEPMNL